MIGKLQFNLSFLFFFCQNTDSRSLLIDKQFNPLVEKQFFFSYPYNPQIKIPSGQILSSVHTFPFIRHKTHKSLREGKKIQI